MSFIHLHVHSEYSLLEAAISVNKLCQKAKEYQMKAVALTDYGNMFGAAEFYFKAKEMGLKPLIGLEAFVLENSKEVFKKKSFKQNKEPFGSVVLLAQNEEGYQNLCHISSMGYKEGFFLNRPTVKYKTLEKYKASLFALTGGIKSELLRVFTQSGKTKAFETIRTLKAIYGRSFYLELSKTDPKVSSKMNSFLLESAEKLKIPLVATNDVHYLDQKDHITREVLFCIGSNKTLQDELRQKLPTDQFYFKNSEEMKSLFQEVPQAIENTLEIENQIHFQFKIQDENKKPLYFLPTYPTQKGFSLKDEITFLSRNGLQKRFLESVERNEEIKKKSSYFNRLDYEIKVIDEMGFSGYFLIVQDIVQWAKKNNIPVGPGRGSGAGSLVAYALGITDLDPLRYGLLFERFLNPERISMPDFDIDFCQEKRPKVIEYVIQKYGFKSVSQITTYGTLQAKAAVRDVGRVMGMNYGEVDKVAKLIPHRLGMQIKRAIAEEPKLVDLMEKSSKVALLMDLAQKIEGFVRHTSIHAAGLIISDGDIVQHAPTWQGAEGESVIQYDKKYAEKIGLIKFDFLGLKTLTHIHECFELIRKNRGIDLTVKDISLSDPGIYEIMRRGDTKGIFQFESPGITDLLQKAKPNCFEDIVAVNALFRPGPMEMIPEYLKRKRGKVQFRPIFPELEDILKETYGIVIYQEQVQLIASRVASFSLAEADILRRAMGKKIPEVMAQQKDRFISGAKKNHFDLRKSEKLFETMKEFAKYGFNKSHAAAYCVIAAQTAYLKRYYPEEFFASLLSTEMSDSKKVARYIKNARNLGIEVLPPHINYSAFKFTVERNKIFFSLGAIKGAGRAAVESIIKTRLSQRNQKFERIEDFFESLDFQKVKKNTIECLIKAGALDGFKYDRGELYKNYSVFIKRAIQKEKDKKIGQRSFFELDNQFIKEDKIEFKNKVHWSKSSALNYEKEVLGFYLSDHPLKNLNSLICENRYLNIESAKSFFLSSAQRKEVFLYGLVSYRKEITTKKGTKMAFLQLEDLSGTIEVIIFPSLYHQLLDSFSFHSQDEVLVVVGDLKKKENRIQCIAKNLMSMNHYLKQTRSIFVRLDLDFREEKNQKMEKLDSLIKNHPGRVPIHFGFFENGSNGSKGSKGFKGLNSETKKIKKTVQANIEFFENLTKLLEGGGEIRLDHSLM